MLSKQKKENNFEIIGRQKCFFDVTDTEKELIQNTLIFFVPATAPKSAARLGLSLQTIIEQHHKGKLELKETKPGKGTIFGIKLPK